MNIPLLNVQSVIDEANAKIADLEIAASALDQDNVVFHRLERVAWISASVLTCFFSKLVEIPYKLSRISPELKRKATLKMYLFRIADIYYCHLGRYGDKNSLAVPKLLITRDKWNAQRKKLLKRIAKLAREIDPSFKDPSKADELKSEYVVITFDRLPDRIKKQFPLQLQDIGIEFLILEFVAMLLV